MMPRYQREELGIYDEDWKSQYQTPVETSKEPPSRLQDRETEGEVILVGMSPADRALIESAIQAQGFINEEFRKRLVVGYEERVTPEDNTLDSLVEQFDEVIEHAEEVEARSEIFNFDAQKYHSPLMLEKILLLSVPRNDADSLAIWFEKKHIERCKKHGQGFANIWYAVEIVKLIVPVIWGAFMELLGKIKIG